MNHLLVRNFPKKDQSVGCYLNSLARDNGYCSAAFMIKQYLNVTLSNADQVSLKMLGDLTGHGDDSLQMLGLLTSDQHDQPTHWYGGLAIPSYHLKKEQWICPHCVNENKYSLAKWRIAWMPVCLKHKKPLVQADRLLWSEGMLVDLDEAANDELYDDRLIHIQEVLDDRLENESKAIKIFDVGEGIIELVEKHLFRSIGEARINQLKDRRRKHSRRYFPIQNRDIPKFMECLFTQLIG